MPQYTELRNDCERIQKIISGQILKKIAFRHFKKDRGTAVRKVLPDKSDHYVFSSGCFNGHIEPNKRRFCNPEYDDQPITTGRIASEPEKYINMVDDLYEEWWKTFGEHREMSSQPSHPGEPPISKEDLKNSLKSIKQKKSIITSDPMLEDLVSAIESKDYRIAAQFLNLDVDPLSLFVPSGEHEMTELFTNGDIHIVYKDRDIALLKPEYDHQLRQRIINQQRSGWGRVRLQGEQPELAFVVGIDDTPTGLFVHSVDGTRLEKNQEISRSYIHDVMGFDRNFRKQDMLNLESGERVRLQGDLAIEKVNKDIPDSGDRCNLPIDNHLGMLSEGSLSTGESKESEPIQVQVPQYSTLNVMHDEHDNVSTQLSGGEYKFYLLPRGLQPPLERPDWTE
jgi:hypothetical protein